MPDRIPRRETFVIDAELVRQLIAAQFPQWSSLPVEPVAQGGSDNRTFRLGERMLVRLPSESSYAAQVEKEQRWLPTLAPLLPLPIPTPLATGTPGSGYPWPWSVYGWLDGETAACAAIADRRAFAGELGRFLTALQRIDATDGPTAGEHNCHRGGPLETYDAETRRTIEQLGARVDAAAISVWSAALSAPWRGAPVWLHGDVAAGNLLVRDGRLCAVIDFGCCGVGDPACDTVMAWTFFDAESRAAFLAALPHDAPMLRPWPRMCDVESAAHAVLGRGQEPGEGRARTRSDRCRHRRPSPERLSGASRPPQMAGCSGSLPPHR